MIDVVLETISEEALYCRRSRDVSHDASEGFQDIEKVLEDALAVTRAIATRSRRQASGGSLGTTWPGSMFRVASRSAAAHGVVSLGTRPVLRIRNAGGMSAFCLLPSVRFGAVEE